MASPLAARSAVSLARQAEAFNLLHPVGTPVRFRTGSRNDGSAKTGTIQEPAYVLGGHTVVVFITGQRSCVAISHVEGIV